MSQITVTQQMEKRAEAWASSEAQAEDAAPHDKCPQVISPEDAARKDARPQVTRPQDEAPEGTRPEDAALRETRQNVTRPESAAPRESRPEGSVPKQRRPNAPRKEGAPRKPRPAGRPRPATSDVTPSDAAPSGAAPSAVAPSGVGLSEEALEVIGRYGKSVSFWPNGSGVYDPDKTVVELVKDRTKLVILGPDGDLDTAFLVAEEMDRSHPSVAVILFATPTARVLERAMHNGIRGVLAPDAPQAELKLKSSRLSSK